MFRYLPMVVFVLLMGFCATGFAADHAVMPLWKLKLEAKLDQRISCDFQAMTLPEVMEFFKTTLGVNVVLSPEAELSDALITLSVKDVQARTALRWVIRQAKMEYVLADQAIYVGPAEEVRKAEPLYFRQYDISDLMLTPGASLVGDDGDDDDDDDDDDSMSSRDAETLVRFIVANTGGPQNWDQVRVIGRTSNDNEN